MQDDGKGSGLVESGIESLRVGQCRAKGANEKVKDVGHARRSRFRLFGTEIVRRNAQRTEVLARKGRDTGQDVVTLFRRACRFDVTIRFATSSAVLGSRTTRAVKLSSTTTCLRRLNPFSAGYQTLEPTTSDKNIFTR